MQTNWAEENLKTIRTLMERSAIYRRALAPIMLFAGFVGVLAAAIGFLSYLDSTIYLWPDIAMFALVGALLIARRQAIRDREPFWSPPARRVVLAMFPSWLIGIIATMTFQVVSVKDPQLSWWLPSIWMILYGLGLYGAGFFMQRGIRLLGWIFILGGLAVSVILTLKSTVGTLPPLIYAHCLMGFFFGMLHLAYGAYLYLTEKRKNAA